MVAGPRRGLTPATDVLVVGAGPTGLATALVAHDHGAAVRIVDRRPNATRPSRAMVVHPRTLESLRPFGVAELLLARGDPAPKAELHVRRRRIPLQLADVGLRDTPFPHLTMLRQMDIEEVLTDALSRRGVDVERGVELVTARTDGTAAHAILNTDHRAERATSRFLVGCDGPASTVRTAAGIGWRGGFYREEVVLADAELRGELTPEASHLVVDRRGLVFVFALGEGATWRILATRPAHAGGAPFGQPGTPVPAGEVRQILDATGLNVCLTELRWSAQVRLQHRLAASFRHGRLFLAGDAAHTHSPAAAQGMNTGILDAVNLGWKLAFAGDDREHAHLLDSYEQERRPAARQVIALTHVAFFAEASTHPVPAFLRGSLVPAMAPLAPVLARQPLLLAQAIKLLSQRWVRYRHSPLSVEDGPRGPGPRAGDRLPDEDVTVDRERVRLHDVISGPGIHVLLQRDADALPDCLGRHVTAIRIGSWPGHGLLAVRPDGHVGLRCAQSGDRRLPAWLKIVAAG